MSGDAEPVASATDLDPHQAGSGYKESRTEGTLVPPYMHHRAMDTSGPRE